MEAVKQDGCALEYASAALKGDREIVMAAVNRHIFIGSVDLIRT